jgi:DNA anti-recombination protein RmuC
MFKFIFRTITLTLFVLFLIIGLAIWKGGDPFRKAGVTIEEAGKIVSRFGTFVDDVKLGGKKVQKTYDQLKDTFSENDLSPKKAKQDLNETVNNSKKPE